MLNSLAFNECEFKNLLMSAIAGEAGLEIGGKLGGGIKIKKAYLKFLLKICLDELRFMNQKTLSINKVI